jgi:hypothetical protein
MNSSLLQRTAGLNIKPADTKPQKKSRKKGGNPDESKYPYQTYYVKKHIYLKRGKKKIT